MPTTTLPDELGDTTGPDITTQSYAGSVFIIPLGAPLPAELKNFEPAKGDLYARLVALATVVQEQAFAFAALTGDELLALTKPWHMLVRAKKVFYLTDLPGARYDVLFTQAVKVLGVPSAPWPSVADFLTSRAIELQRLGDKEPWNAPEARKEARRLRTPTLDAEPLTPPPAELQTAEET